MCTTLTSTPGQVEWPSSTTHSGHSETCHQLLWGTLWTAFSRHFIPRVTSLPHEACITLSSWDCFPHFWAGAVCRAPTCFVALAPQIIIFSWSICCLREATCLPPSASPHPKWAAEISSVRPRSWEGQDMEMAMKSLNSLFWSKSLSHWLDTLETMTTSISYPRVPMNDSGVHMSQNPEQSIHCT